MSRVTCEYRFHARIIGHFDMVFRTADDILQHAEKQHFHTHFQLLSLSDERARKAVAPVYNRADALASGRGPQESDGTDLTRLELIAMSSHLTRVRVRYAETDQMGVVHHASYLVWMEVARVEYCRQAGFRYKDLEDEHGVFWR